MTSERKVALITGGTSGIGLAAGRRLAGAGYRVFGTTRSARLRTLDGIEIVEADVTKDRSVDDVVARIIAAAGRIDLLVNNAGIGVSGAAEESSISQAQRLFDTNLFGVFRMTRAVLPLMRQRGAGRILNVSSVLGFLPAPFAALYASSKHAMEGYSVSLDHEVRTRGIRVLLIEPAYTSTSFDKNMADADGLLEDYAEARQALRPLVAKSIAEGDEPDVVARVILEAATDRRPKLRYPAGRLARQLSLINRLAPTSFVDARLRAQLRLDA